ncbi:MAG: lamin tail domain-containing protein, partial [Chloroflexi bacterium]|nr:lamin tail domain-containing protein [Chloroflexota bacterium]
MPYSGIVGKVLFFSLFSLLSLLALLFLAGLPSARAVSTTLVISEFRVRGPNGGNDEFIELYNLSTAPVNIGGWKVKGSNNAGSTSVRATIPTGTILNPGCHYLLTNSSTSGGPYSGSVPGDQTYSTGITDDGGIALTLPDDTIVDQVGMSSGSAFKEGTPLPSLGSSNLDRSYERKPGGASGSGVDTDNNVADFQLISPSDPQNLSSPPTPPETPTPTPTTTPSATPSPTPSETPTATPSPMPGETPTATP